MSLFEAVGFGYTVLATLVFTAQVIYCAAKGVSVLRHYVARGRGGPESRAAAPAAADNNSKRSVLKISS